MNAPLPALSARQSAIELSATIAMAERARALRAEGRDIISLSLGEPDFPTPPHAVEAAHQAALRGETKYPAVGGSPALKAAIAAKFFRDSGLRFGPDQILVAHGAKQIIYDALTASLDPGSEVIIPAPYWNAYPLITRMAQGVPVFLPCDAEDDFLPRPERLEAAITPRTRWVILNFPSNPTGAVCPAPHLAALAEVLRAHPHVWIMSDDMYEHLIHDGSANATIASVAPDLAGRVLTISGVSKTYAMTGWRVGYAGGARTLIAAMAKIQGQATGGVSPIAQAAAVAALEGPQDQVAAMRATYAARSRRVGALLAAIPGLACRQPAGAFYLYPSVAAFIGARTAGGRRIGSDADFCEALLEEAGVAAVHGGSFGASPYIRISTASSDAQLEAACLRIAGFCLGLQKEAVLF